MRIKTSNKLFRLIAGFSIVGFFVTVLSLILAYLFLKIIGTPLVITYILIYIPTVIISFSLNSKLIFKTGFNLRNFIVYCSVYGVGLLLGTGLLLLFKMLLPFENWVLSYLVLPFTILSNFTLSYYFLK